MTLSKLSIFSRSDALRPTKKQPTKEGKDQRTNSEGELTPLTPEQMKEKGFLPKPINTKYVRVSEGENKEKIA